MERLTLRLLLAQSADVFTFLAFYLFVGAAVHEERNPLLIVLMAMGGLAAVALVKMAVTLVVIYRYQHATVTITKRWFTPLRTVLISAATASGIVGAGFNLAAIMTS